MLRWLTILVFTLVLLVRSDPAAAHTMDLSAQLSLADGQISVHLLDPYGAAVGGGEVSAQVRPEGSQAAVLVVLSEVVSGTYSAALPRLNPGQRFDLQVEALLGADRYRLDLQGLIAGGANSTHTWPMPAVEGASFPWGVLMYGAALVMTGAAATVALVRRRAAGGTGGPGG